jgi:hypothetical protein
MVSLVEPFAKSRKRRDLWKREVRRDFTKGDVDISR